MNKKWVLIVILIFAAILRIWKLGSVPPSLTPDEAALGYNAFSILHTGRDEFGKFIPIVFKSFGDYKPGLYVYLTIPSIAILGLSEFSTRLPSAVFGLLTVFLIYIISSELFSKKMGFLPALIAAISPYLIYFSRGAWEANISLTLSLAGIYFFLKAMEKSKYLLLSSVFFALTLVTYQGAKLSTAIVIGLLILIYWKDFWKLNIKDLVVSLGIGIAISVPIILTLFNGEVQRLTIFSVFSYPRPESEIQTYSDGYFVLFHSNQLNYFRMVMSRWFNFYSGQFLVFEGDLANPVHTAPYQGVLLLADLFTFPIGLFVLFKNKITKSSLFVILWLVLAPFSAAISRDQTNAVRSLNASVPIILIISLGISSVIDWSSKQKTSLLFFLLLSGVYVFSFIYFIDAYFVHLPAHNSNFWRYGYKEAVSYLSPIESNYKTIVFEQSFNQPYIYFLFYQKYTPTKWQSQSKLVSSQYIGDVGFETEIDNVQFKQIDWSQLKNAHSTLVVLSPGSIPPEILSKPDDYPIIHEIKYLNGRDVAFDVIAIK